MARRSARSATLAGFAAAAALAAGTLAVTVPAATAAETGTTGVCSYGHSNKDGGSGTITASALARRSGPYLSCDAYGQAGQGTKIYYWCYRVGSSVNGKSTWTYGRIDGTGQEGWFADAYLSNGGATHAC
ncbi:hypothetical protein [Kitasatospora sp. NPDC088346]|uniref:hypothetical protein n=1 Tax=Kitasatospora sp. NPDC088346 TaxID=3364073 RepID=UPI00382D0267